MLQLLKKINAWLHLWLGIASGIVVIVVSLTGCILVFESELEGLTMSHLHAENPDKLPMLPPSKLLPAAQAAMPGKEISGIWYHGAGKTAHFSLNSDSAIYINPYTAKVVALVDHEDFFHFILDGHTGLWLESDLGHAIVSYATLIFLIITISGLILWWPKKWNKVNTDKSLKIKWSAKFKRLNYDLHNVLGFYSMTIAVILAVTGLIMGFAWFNKGFYWLTNNGEAIPAYKPAYSDTTMVNAIAGLENVDRAWKKGVEEIGVYDKEAIIVSFPEKGSDPISLCTDMYNGSWRYVYLDQHTLAELPESQTQISNLNVGQWLRRTNYAMHVGAVGGITTKILFFLASLICTSLPITGFYIWWGKRSKGKSAKIKASRNFRNLTVSTDRN